MSELHNPATYAEAGVNLDLVMRPRSCSIVLPGIPGNSVEASLEK